MGVNPQERMGWQRYGAALVLSNALMMLLGYLLLRCRRLPLNPLEIAAQAPDLAFNTAASFITNTNWQAYAGENSLSNATQMVVITFLMFAGATTGWRPAGLCARSGAVQRPGYRQLLGRLRARVLARAAAAVLHHGPGLCLAGHSADPAHRSRGDDARRRRQQLLMGPVASLESIKHLGTNGGGFFSMNAAHPFENPTPLTNLLHILSMLLIPAGMTYAFGSMLLRRKQGWVLFAACMVMFVGFLSLVFVAEQNGSQLLARAGADQQYSLTQSGGNMEGKELRFGIADTACS
jgi:K+-transporting ATPase ATPase A chain